MIPASFDYESPKTLNEALSLLASHEDAKLLAGGHSLLPAMKLRLANPALLIDLGRIGGLDYIRDGGDTISIGALTTHGTVASSPLLLSSSPLLAQAAANIGDIQVRNRGTIGGSLAQAHPSADYPAAVLALDAQIAASSQSGERVIPAREFFTGMFTTALRPDEIITEIRVPKTAGAGTVYKKFAHPASGYAVVGVAAVVRGSTAKIDEAAVGITGVGEIAYRAEEVETALRGKPASSIAEAAKHAADKVEA
ncbi:MAG TPA: xanthine dehydrogenase family protein subunit M, partial [Terriglobales bacterium]|nr:xanthine dehydrogenase family protein subunit M [Terriglobales bacterium]